MDFSRLNYKALLLDLDGTIELESANYVLNEFIKYN